MQIPMSLLSKVMVHLWLFDYLHSKQLQWLNGFFYNEIT